jgi:hypothetical protein
LWPLDARFLAGMTDFIAAYSVCSDRALAWQTVRRGIERKAFTGDIFTPARPDYVA